MIPYFLQHHCQISCEKIPKDGLLEKIDVFPKGSPISRCLQLVFTGHTLSTLPSHNATQISTLHPSLKCNKRLQNPKEKNIRKTSTPTSSPSPPPQKKNKKHIIMETSPHFALKMTRSQKKGKKNTGAVPKKYPPAPFPPPVWTVIHKFQLSGVRFASPAPQSLGMG